MIARAQLRRLPVEEVLRRARMDVPGAIRAVHDAAAAAAREFWMLGTDREPPIVQHAVRLVVVELAQCTVSAYARAIERDHSSVFKSLPVAKAKVLPAELETLMRWARTRLAQRVVEVDPGDPDVVELRERVERLEGQVRELMARGGGS